MSLLRLSIAPLLFILAGCGTSLGSGGATGDLHVTVSEDTAPYAILDLSTGVITWSLTLPAGAADPTLRTTHMAFRRVTVGGTDAMIGVFEVTQAQWQLLYGAPAPATWPWEDVPDPICDGVTAHGTNRPAYNLEYETTLLVLDAYAVAGGGRLTLPTDAQWSAACGVASGWSWGTTTSQAQLVANAVVRESVMTPARLDAGGVDIAGPVAVGSRAANARGFYDLHGNVWELILGGDHARGGSWRDSAWQSRSEASLGAGQGFHAELDYTLVGMRLVLVP